MLPSERGELISPEVHGHLSMRLSKAWELPPSPHPGPRAGTELRVRTGLGVGSSLGTDEQ